MKISYLCGDNLNVATGDKPSPKILAIEVEGNCDLMDEIIEKFFRMLVKHPEEMEWKE